MSEIPEKKCPLHICTEHVKIIAVSGFQADKKKSQKKFVMDLKESAWKLYSYIADKSVRKQEEEIKRKFIAIVNHSSDLHKVDDGDVDALRNELYTMSCCGDGITCIIFAHHDGANIVHEALEEEGLLKVLKSRGKIEEVKNHLAVFTFGGTCTIEKSAAQVAVNFTANDDKAPQDRNAFVFSVKIQKNDGTQSTSTGFWGGVMSSVDYKYDSDLGVKCSLDGRSLFGYAVNNFVRAHCAKYLSSIKEV